MASNESPGCTSVELELTSTKATGLPAYFAAISRSTGSYAWAYGQVLQVKTTAVAFALETNCASSCFSPSVPLSAKAGPFLPSSSSGSWGPARAGAAARKKPHVSWNRVAKRIRASRGAGFGVSGNSRPAPGPWFPAPDRRHHIPYETGTGPWGSRDEARGRARAGPGGRALGTSPPTGRFPHLRRRSSDRGAG